MSPPPPILQSHSYDLALFDAETALEFDPCFVKGLDCSQV